MKPLPQFSNDAINKWAIEKWRRAVSAACKTFDHDAYHLVGAVTITSWIDDAEGKRVDLAQIGNALGDMYNLNILLWAKGDYLTVRITRRGGHKS